MASHNQLSQHSNQKNTNIISTRKIVRKHKRDGIKTAQTDTNNVPRLETNNISIPTSQSETFFNQQSVNHNQYSARNSLRAAKTITVNDKSQSSKKSELTMTTAFLIAPERGVLDDSNYDRLDSECFFIDTENQFSICLLCGLRLQSGALETHSRSNNHNINYLRLRFYLATALPADNSLQMCAIGELLSNWCRSQSLTVEMLAQRYDVIGDFEYILRIINPECGIRLLGSMNTRTSLVSSDINLELLHPNSRLFEADPRAKNSIHHKLIDPDADYGSQINNHILHYDLIPNAFETLQKIMHTISNKYPNSLGNTFDLISTVSDLNGKIPKLILQHVASKVYLEVICYGGSSYKLSNLLGTYLSLDERAPVLATLIKLWAKNCRINKPDCGTYPPDAFIILVIYYLQRTSPPILPCLHGIISEANKKVETTPESGFKAPTDLLGNLKLQDNLPEDVDSLTAGQNTINHKGISEELQEGNIEVADEEEEDGEGDDGGCLDVDSEFVKNLNWISKNDTPVHKLFIDFLSTMIEVFRDTSSIITIRTLENVAVSSKGWTTSIKAIENPVSTRVNISRCIGSHRTFEYIRSAFKQGYYYLTSIPMDLKLKPKLKPELDPIDYIELYVNRRRFNSYARMKEGSIHSECDYDPITQMIKQDLFARDVEVINALFNNFSGNYTNLPKTVANFYNENFLLPKDVAATTFCWLCKKTGHSRNVCPSWRVEKLDLEFENYDIELDFRADFDASFLKLYNLESISPGLSNYHNIILKELAQIIKSTGLDCKLQLFGSTVNDLGSRDSDLDICMTLDGDPTGKNVDCVAILNRVNSVLSRSNRVRSLEAILSARVPILKFRFDSTDVDLSMYNLCAISNSKLLKTYARFDRRVAPLFFLVKRYAKCCGIADASKGSLSSYAWSLMVIHYLQQTNPPILPVLQECPEGRKKPVIGVNGWNVWFNSDVDSYRLQENTSSLTQLFKGFFLYYGTFDFSCNIVSIRKPYLLSRYKKNWNHCMMAIEDPFELTYNLSSRLDDQMSIYIMNSFVYIFRHIVRVQNEYIREESTTADHHCKRIFVGRDIMPTGPPYRGCRRCSKIGHKLKDCPKRFNQNGPRGARSRN